MKHRRKVDFTKAMRKQEKEGTKVPTEYRGGPLNGLCARVCYERKGTETDRCSSLIMPTFVKKKVERGKKARGEMWKEGKEHRL